MTQTIRINHSKGMSQITLSTKLFNKVLIEMSRVTNEIARGKITRVKPVLSKVKVIYEAISIPNVKGKKKCRTK